MSLDGFLPLKTSPERVPGNALKGSAPTASVAALPIGPVFTEEHKRVLLSVRPSHLVVECLYDVSR